MEKLLDVLQALSDETRLRILNLLYENELCVCDVMGSLQISQAKASRHLIRLKNAGLVKDRKQAQWAFYSMSKDVRLKFIDNLVIDNLRQMELYIKDMEHFKEWRKKNKDQCS